MSAAHVSNPAGLTAAKIQAMLDYWCQHARPEEGGNEVFVLEDEEGGPPRPPSPPKGAGST